jgi:hypothetical protein
VRNASTHEAPRPDAASALCIAAGSVLSVALMLFHPTTAGSGAAAIEEMAREAARSGWVHGGLVALLALLLAGYAGLAHALGPRSPAVRAGVVAYLLGVLLLSGAALVNGFVVPRLAARYAGLPDPEIQPLVPLLRLCFQTNQTLAQAGTIALSAAIAAWSAVLLRRARAIGALGLFVGAAPIVGLVSGHLRLHLHGMGAVVLAQAVWGVCVAVWLARGPSPEEAR